MSSSTPQQRQQWQSLDRSANRSTLEQLQLEKFNRLLSAILPANGFYANKLSDQPAHLDDLAQLAEFPLTSKEELQQEPPCQWPRNLTHPVDDYVRFHQTSGTRGRPMTVLDTVDDWEWWIDCWQYVLDAAEVTAQDRAFLAFSFGPFIGFWSAFDAIASRGALAIPGGGVSSMVRLEMIRRSEANVLFCTPTYALHLAEVAREHQFDLQHLSIEKIIVAGEPGGSIPALRERIETAWRATVFDHAGASEIGAWGFPDASRIGLHVAESEFVAEFLSVATGEPAADGELSHLVLTTLGRAGCPVIRYRTGDLVCPRWKNNASSQFVLLEGGVLGRADDMMIIRGVNIFPSSIEQILHSFPEVVEYRITAHRAGELDQLTVEVEDRLAQPARIADELRLQLGLAIEVRIMPPMSLPRFEAKGNRFVDNR